MTISEYMNDLTLESMAVANEMANDAMLCDFYTAFSDEEVNVASESVDLAFDDDDDLGTGIDSTEPATEAGFFKSLGNKFKSVIETVKGWFEKVANAIKGWITKFVDRIKDKVAKEKNKKTAMAIAGAKADMEYSEAQFSKREAEIDENLATLRKQYADETNGTKKQQIKEKIANLEKQKAQLSIKKASFDKTKAVPLAKIFAQRVADCVQQAEKSFKVACSDQDAIEKILLTIMTTKINPNSKNTDLVEDRLYDNGRLKGDYKADRAVLSKVKGADKMVTDLDKMLEGLNKIASQLESSKSELDKAFDDFSEAAPDEKSRVSALKIVKVRIPSSELVAKATYMQDQCNKLAKKADGLKAVFGKEPDEGEKDKRPAIAKAVSAYSTVAHKLVNIANQFLGIASKAESCVIAGETNGD